MTATNERAENVFLTPRVIDQTAFDDLAGTLRDLIGQAQAVGRELGEHVEQAGESKREQARSAEQLQERLRLSARMLKAFQSQIARTETSIAELESHEGRVKAIEEKAEQIISAAGERIESALEAAMDQFQQRLESAVAGALEQLDSEVQARTDRVQRLAAEIDALVPATERLSSAAEQAEVTVTTMAYRAATVAVELDERGRDMHALLERADTASNQLDEEIAEARQRLSSEIDRGGQIADELRGLSADGESTREALSHHIDAASEASRSLAIDLQACEALETLLEQLKPWEALAFGSGEGGRSPESSETELPEPAARLVEELRGRLDRDLDAFSSVLEHVAEQFRNFSCRAHARREARELDAHDDRGESNAGPASGSGDEGVVSVIHPASSLSFSSHPRVSRAE